MLSSGAMADSNTLRDRLAMLDEELPLEAAAAEDGIGGGGRNGLHKLATEHEKV